MRGANEDPIGDTIKKIAFGWISVSDARKAKDNLVEFEVRSIDHRHKAYIR